ncbi:MAG TPA: hypothetical protein VN442_15420, partial [Bryobacteraceae bacterium]|nr:hypothetical protein [Bryobacteraceae bacterium]
MGLIVDDEKRCWRTQTLAARRVAAAPADLPRRGSSPMSRIALLAAPRISAGGARNAAHGS